MDAQLLADAPLFDGVDADTIERCATFFDERNVAPGTELAKQEDFAYRFFVILDGEVEVERSFDHLAQLGPGDFFGEMGLQEGGRRNARVVARSRCQLASIVLWDYRKMVDECPIVAERIEQAITDRT